MSSPAPPIACSLDVRDAQTRRARWQALADAALIDRDRTAKGARQTYRAEPRVERDQRAHRARGGLLPLPGIQAPSAGR